ncbi:LOW QUALITY PROTEIN: guanine nucleotide exchange factor VAV3-like [Rhinoraja longicauda]
MELWRQCSLWLSGCGLLPAGHRLRGSGARLPELAQWLRDGVMLCRLLGVLRPGSVPANLVSPRPRMSQFLCLKNIRTFLSTCCDTFGMRRSDLFDAFDLFDVRDFAKVIDTLSRLSHTAIALSTGIRALTLTVKVLASFQLASVRAPVEHDVRSCCLLEITQTEDKYTETLESIGKFFIGPLDRFLTPADMDTIFINVEELTNVHRELNVEVKSVVMSKNHQNLYQVFLKYKARLLVYGEYCCKVEEAIKCLDEISKSRPDLCRKFEECARRANNGKFTLRDLLVVPMQRVLKYHLLLQELAKQTTDRQEKTDLRLALDAMKVSVRGGSLHRNVAAGGHWLQTRSNIRPDDGDSNEHSFTMHTFAQVTVCNACNMLLRGIFYQGYLCTRCGSRAHKECLGRIGICGSIATDPRRDQQTNGFNGDEKQSCSLDTGLPRMQVTQCYRGSPQPPAPRPGLPMQPGDVIEVYGAEAHSTWWQGRNLTTREVGFFPRDCVHPLPCVPKGVDYSGFTWFAGAIDRLQAEAELIGRSNRTFLVRQRPKELEEFAISISYNSEVKHIKIISRDSSFFIAQNKRFRTLKDLVDYYGCHSLREGFRCLDTTLQVPYKEPETVGCNQTAQATGSAAPCLRALGLAVAQYDFSARDLRELSLKKGDVVMIHSKTGTDGWWRGSVNGRVGWFPCTYVEEDCFMY